MKFVHTLTAALTLAAFAPCIGPAYAQEAKPAAVAEAKPVLLAYTLKKGDTWRYKLTLASQVNGTDVTSERTTKVTVKEVKDNGDVVLTLKDEGGFYEYMGTHRDSPPGPDIAETQSKTGRLMEWKPAEEATNGIMAAPVENIMAIGFHAVIFDKPVPPGEKWRTTYDNPAVKDKKFTVVTTYVGTEKVDGIEAWKLKQKTEADVEGGTMSLEMTTWLDPATGQTLKTEQIGADAPTRFGAMSWTGKSTRLKADADKDKKDAAGDKKDAK